MVGTSIQSGFLFFVMLVSSPFHTPWSLLLVTWWLLCFWSGWRGKEHPSAIRYRRSSVRKPSDRTFPSPHSFLDHFFLYYHVMTNQRCTFSPSLADDDLLDHPFRQEYLIREHAVDCVSRLSSSRLSLLTLRREEKGYRDSDSQCNLLFGPPDSVRCWASSSLTAPRPPSNATTKAGSTGPLSSLGVGSSRGRSGSMSWVSSDFSTPGFGS